VTALLLAPTIVIGVFGANIVQFAPGSRGTLLQLGQWAVLASGLSMAILWWRMPPPTVRPAFRAVPAALAVLLLGVGIVLTAAGRVEQAVLWSTTVAVWLGATLVALRRPGARTPQRSSRRKQRRRI